MAISRCETIPTQTVSYARKDLCIEVLKKGVWTDLLMIYGRAHVIYYPVGQNLTAVNFLRILPEPAYKPSGHDRRRRKADGRRYRIRTGDVVKFSIRRRASFRRKSGMFFIFN